MFTPTAIRDVALEGHTTPSGRQIPLNTKMNRNRLSAAFLANGDRSMTPVMCGFYLQAIALDPSSSAFTDARTVAHRFHATYPHREMHFAIAAAMRIQATQMELFRTIAAG